MQNDDLNFTLWKRGMSRKDLQTNETTTNRNIQLETQPHYSNPAYSDGSAHTVFGVEEKGLMWNYDDHLQQWNYDKHKQAWHIACSSDFVKRSANFYELYLSEYHGEPMQLVCVKAGVNVGNGYPYVVFGYKKKEK